MDEVMKRVMAKLAKQEADIADKRAASNDAWEAAERILGRFGAMLSGSKTSPNGQKVVWNANICTREHGKIWFGDFNVTTGIDKLKELAKALNTRVYVLYEMDARFDNELNPRFEDAVISVNEND